MHSTSKKLRQDQSSSLLSHSAIISSNMIGDSSLVFHTDQLEQSININVESHVVVNLLSYAKQLHELLDHDERFSKDYFEQIENNNNQTSHVHSNQSINELIQLTEFYLGNYLSSSVILRCYIQLHRPSSESGNNQGVQIQKQIVKEIEEMETIIKSNEILFLDYYKKHYQIFKSLHKYPSIEDYHLYLIAYERKIFDDIRAMILELRTMFLKTYDLIRKNLTTIQIPRNQDDLVMIA